MTLKNHAILLISCTDRKGLLSIITQFLYQHNGNIVDLDEHVDKQQGLFFMRVEWELEGFDLDQIEIEKELKKELFADYEMKWQLFFTSRKPRMAIFVSKASHCLYDILARYYSGEWQVEIPLIISNHLVHHDVADRYQIPFYFFDVAEANKTEVEQEQLTLLKEKEVDFLILARYMQILSEDFIKHYPNKIINIHHSFLPAFAGAKPYHRAYDRGVKIIGATSHYVTADLDAGPILEQEVTKISHKDEVEDLIRKGKDLEKIVLSRAIWIHLQRKALVYQNKTIIF
ncbi:MAG: formyltetrahydrofolate deformylase [Bacteroidota bacterium]